MRAFLFRLDLKCWKNCLSLALLWQTFLSTNSLAFAPADRWGATALGSAGQRGEPITLTWSLVPDGTEVSNGRRSELISWLDNIFDVVSTETELTQRPWFPLFDSAFQRWGELGGLAFVYEARDDGLPHRNHPGKVGFRGDIRLAAAPLDGPEGTLATSHFPDTADILLDVQDVRRFGNSEQNFLRLRNTLMHEIGHSFGLDHITSSDAQLLMEPALRINFDGPQLDDIRGLHHLYGDRFEVDGGNGSLASATFLGPLLPGEQIVLGDPGRDGLKVEPEEFDFVSITRRSDQDYYSFDLDSSAELDVLLVPQGGEFMQGAPGEVEQLTNANATSDLLLTLYAPNGSVLSRVNQQPRGHVEQFDGFPISDAGRYVLSVSGSSEVVQLYSLQLRRRDTSLLPEPSTGWLTVIVLLRLVMSRDLV